MGLLPLGLISSRRELFQFISTFAMPVGLFFWQEMYVLKGQKFVAVFNVHRVSFAGVSFDVVGA